MTRLILIPAQVVMVAFMGAATIAMLLLENIYVAVEMRLTRENKP